MVTLQIIWRKIETTNPRDSREFHRIQQMQLQEALDSSTTFCSPFLPLILLLLNIYKQFVTNCK